MRKSQYRSVSVKKVDVQRAILSPGGPLVLGIDVAKESFFASVMGQNQKVLVTVRWKHPVEHREFIQFVSRLREISPVEAVMEPSGVYGDAVRYALLQSGVSVFRVNPKQSHDAAEVYDGVPSLHDAKSAAIVAKLHLDGRSEPWPFRDELEQGLAAVVRQLEVFEKQFRQNRNRLEGLLARHWPELSRTLGLESVTLLELLIKFGCPEKVAHVPKEAQEFMQSVGGPFLSKEKILAVTKGAKKTVGVPTVSEERELIMLVASEARRSQKIVTTIRRKIELLVGEHESSARLQAVIGKTTSAVIVAAVGDPQKYTSSRAYEKALGLNVREKSSGKKKGGLHITKRGPGVSRLYLYLAALRLIQRDPVVRAWYAKKVGRQGGIMKSKAVVAVMRKLSRALWYVARGAPFDSSLLFDTTRLSLSEAL